MSSNQYNAVKITSSPTFMSHIIFIELSKLSSSSFTLWISAYKMNIWNFLLE